MTTLTVEWLMSSYDKTWHAYPAEQLADPAPAFLTALCGHSVSARCVALTPPDELCPACVRALGTRLPDISPWRMGD